MSTFEAIAADLLVPVAVLADDGPSASGGADESGSWR